ncbi:polysaccharide synthase [Xylariaceae sp. FL0594]|nr:polysaccharide synthase [Xylariaceae sp. FL0594]
MSAVAFPTILVGFWAWGKAEAWHLSRYQYKPVPIPLQPNYKTQDVSLIVPSVGPDENFAECLRSWLENRPGEIIIVTVDRYRKRVAGILEDAKRKLGPQFPGIQNVQLVVLPSDSLGVRKQFIEGVNKAKGSIIAKVDDHILWPHPDFLQHMLACFEDPEVGGVAPTCGLYMSEKRQNEEVVTPWEVAAARSIWKGKARYLTAYAASNWIWVLPGMTVFYRSIILQNVDLQKTYLNEYWGGNGPMDAHEDGALTRWAHQHDWKLCLQNAGPETEIRRTVKRDKAFLAQFFRWERGTIQSHRHLLRSVPQIWLRPWVAWKTLERTFRPVITTIHIVAWIGSFVFYPRTSALFILYYIICLAPSHAAFIAEHPYMWRHWWAAVLVDFFYIIQDYYCCWTLSDVSFCL